MKKHGIKRISKDKGKAIIIALIIYSVLNIIMLKVHNNLINYDIDSLMKNKWADLLFYAYLISTSIFVAFILILLFKKKK